MAQSKQQVCTERANAVCRELRYLIAEDGVVTRSNSDRLLQLLHSWMYVAPDNKYTRPERVGLAQLSSHDFKRENRE